MTQDLAGDNHWIDKVYGMIIGSSATAGYGALVVNRAEAGKNATAGVTYFNKDSYVGANTNTSHVIFSRLSAQDFNCSIYANQAIAAQGDLITTQNVQAVGNLNFSDTRSKNIKGLSNSTEDLKTLRQIRITNYSLIDPKSTMGGLNHLTLGSTFSNG